MISALGRRLRDQGDTRDRTARCWCFITLSTYITDVPLFCGYAAAMLGGRVHSPATHQRRNTEPFLISHELREYPATFFVGHSFLRLGSPRSLVNTGTESRPMGQTGSACSRSGKEIARAFFNYREGSAAVMVEFKQPVGSSNGARIVPPVRKRRDLPPGKGDGVMTYNGDRID